MSTADAPVDLELVGIGKRYGEVEALCDCSLEVHRGETLVLLGPSGCGKTTLLSIIAGFERPDRGSLRLGGRTLGDEPPNRRNVGMVFQHYALFPHLSVRENIAYGLRARGVPRGETDARVEEMVVLLKLDGLWARLPAELSGGQRQRVAVARALAVRPVVLLLDEALSALDKNLREQMQLELSLLVRRLGITTILVTHDQREAFAMGHRIAVMAGGRIVQCGPPEEIYARPADRFVLEFVGSVNRLPGVVRSVRGGVAEVLGPGGLVATGAWTAGGAPSAALLYLRAEDVRLSRAPTAVHPVTPGRVEMVTFLGSVRRYIVALGEHQLVAELPSTVGLGVETGVPVYLDFDASACRLVPDA